MLFCPAAFVEPKTILGLPVDPDQLLTQAGRALFFPQVWPVVGCPSQTPARASYSCFLLLPLDWLAGPSPSPTALSLCVVCMGRGL